MRCTCCQAVLDPVYGCPICNSYKMYCQDCGTLTQCGCGRDTSHQCGEVAVVVNHDVVFGTVVEPEVVIPVASIIRPGFITEDGKLLN